MSLFLFDALRHEHEVSVKSFQEDLCALIAAANQKWTK
jgi:hypothetical protein